MLNNNVIHGNNPPREIHVRITKGQTVLGIQDSVMCYTLVLFTDIFS